MNAEAARPLLSMLTDFGTSDSYVAQMKAVVLGAHPDANIIDVTHDIEPQNVAQASFVLSTAIPSFPPGSVHVVVVDPGVGSDRVAVAFEFAKQFFVGPGNGVFDDVLDGDVPTRWVELDAASRASGAASTFHGRDWFAPVAARLAGGADLSEFGEPKTGTPLPGSSSRPAEDASGVGAVVHIDHFGNAITSIRSLDVLGIEVERASGLGKLRLDIRDHYAEVGAGEALALRGSRGHIEVAVRDGSASDSLGIRVGDRVRPIDGSPSGD